MSDDRAVSGIITVCYAKTLRNNYDDKTQTQNYKSNINGNNKCDIKNSVSLWV